MSTDISRDAWLAALHGAADAGDPESMTSGELGDLLGVTRRTALEHARRLIKAGKAERTTKRIRRGNGYLQVVTSYRLLRSK